MSTTSSVEGHDLFDHLHDLPPVEIVYTDLDGTLLGRNGSVLHDADGAPDDRAVRALVAAAQSGVAVVGVSGRAARMLEQNARLLGLDGAIAEVGAVIIRGREHHFEWGEAPRGIADDPRQTLDAVGAADVLFELYPDDLRYYEPWDQGREGDCLLVGLVDTGRCDQALAEAGIGWAKIVDNGLTRGWRGRDDVRAYHLVARGVGKARAVADDLIARGIPADRAMAVGDSLEDQTMAEVVGTYVIVGNGHGEPGGNRFTVTGRNGAGVAQAVTAALRRSGR
ncbi:HAD family hydrolase [Euzebya tangerina]|uniref:HAD family hydrolase n=1 Tax=Euzebya tangerina TaxID=591198 RepID=UPI000E3181E3|nr:HAD hydrolase family protein [Euzebya tangerina]